MTIPADPDEWDLAHLEQLVTQNELESSRVEYKRDLSNTTIDAIDAIANTFGGVVLIGVTKTSKEPTGSPE